MHSSSTALPSDMQQPDTLQHPARISLAVIFIGLALTAMGQTILFAVLGPVARVIGISELETGLIISVSALMVVLISPTWGRISDRMGRKPVFAFSLAGYCVTSMVFAYLLQLGLNGQLTGPSALFILIAARVLYAIFASGGQPAAGGYIADTSTPEARSGAMALIGGAFGIGSILGPAAAFALGGWGVLVPLYVIAALGGLTACAAWFFMQDSVPQEDGIAAPATLRATDPRIVWLMLGIVFVFTAFSMVQQTLSFYVQDLWGLSAAEAAQRTGLLISVLALANVATFIAVVSLKPKAEMLVVIAGLSAGSGILLLLFPVSISLVMVAHVLMGIGFGAFLPAAQTRASLAVDSHHQGAAAGFVSSAMAGGFIVGPLLGSGLYMIAPKLTYGTASAVFVLGCIVASLHTRAA